MATNLKIVVVGDGTVGKTCLLLTYANGVFPTEYVPTIFDSYDVDLTIGGKDYTIGLFDTAGQEDYNKIRPLSYPNTDVFIVCFAVDNPDSYDNVKHTWVPDIKNYGAPYIIVGTKADKREEGQTTPNTKFITSRNGNALAEKVNAKCYVECSAIKNIGVKEAFDHAIMVALEQPSDDKPEMKHKKCTIV